MTSSLGRGNFGLGPLSLRRDMTFHLGPLSRRARMFLHLVAGCLGLCVLIGPTLLALASSPPFAAAVSWTPPRLIAVQPFHDLSADTYFPEPPLRAGPTAVQGRIIGRDELNRWLAASVFACIADNWAGDVTIRQPSTRPAPSQASN